MNWASLSTGIRHSVAIKTDGTLWAWGWNEYGQLGDGASRAKNEPTRIGTATNWASVSAGFGHTIATKTDGSIWAWGWNSYGQLGNRTDVNRSSPVQIPVG